MKSRWGVECKREGGGGEVGLRLSSRRIFFSLNKWRVSEWMEHEAGRCTRHGKETLIKGSENKQDYGSGL